MYKLVLRSPRRIHLEPRKPLHRLDRRGPDPHRRCPGQTRPANLLKAEGLWNSMWPTPACSSARRGRLWHCLDEMDRTWLPVAHVLAPERTPLRRARRASTRRIWPSSTAMPRCWFGAAATMLRHPPWKPPTRAASAATCATPSCSQSRCRLTECLKDAVARVMPFWNEVDGTGHQSRQADCRCGSRQLDTRLGEVPGPDFRRRHRGGQHPNGIPSVYELDADLKPIRHYYLGDAEAAAKAAAAGGVFKARPGASTDNISHFPEDKRGDLALSPVPRCISVQHRNTRGSKTENCGLDRSGRRRRSDDDRVAANGGTQRIQRPGLWKKLQQLAAVFGMVKSDYVKPVDEKKLITEASCRYRIRGLDPHSQYFDKKSFRRIPSKELSDQLRRCWYRSTTRKMALAQGAFAHRRFPGIPCRPQTQRPNYPG